ncbi:MAG: hypothetical protein JST86_19425 [Bacteroidetes bacterium]|nr:hypothetical protein [Bacteroidota bacterium]
MAIILLNSSICALCGKILAETDEVIGLPPVSFSDHPLYKYFDSGFHKQCYDTWNEKETIEELIRQEKINFNQSDYYKEMMAKYGKP